MIGSSPVNPPLPIEWVWRDSNVLSKNRRWVICLSSVHGDDIRTIVQDVQFLLDEDYVLDLVVPIKNIRLFDVCLDLGLDVGGDCWSHDDLVADMEAFLFDVSLEIGGDLRLFLIVFEEFEANDREGGTKGD
jgi:hypothetical protein